MVLLAMRMVADVTETCNVIPSLEFKTCMTIKSYVFNGHASFEFQTRNVKLGKKLCKCKTKVSYCIKAISIKK